MIENRNAQYFILRLRIAYAYSQISLYPLVCPSIGLRMKQGGGGGGWGGGGGGGKEGRGKWISSAWVSATPLPSLQIDMNDVALISSRLLSLPFPFHFLPGLSSSRPPSCLLFALRFGTSKSGVWETYRGAYNYLCRCGLVVMALTFSLTLFLSRWCSSETKTQDFQTDKQTGKRGWGGIRTIDMAWSGWVFGMG